MTHDLIVLMIARFCFSMWLAQNTAVYKPTALITAVWNRCSIATESRLMNFRKAALRRWATIDFWGVPGRSLGQSRGPCWSWSWRRFSAAKTCSTRIGVAILPATPKKWRCLGINLWFGGFPWISRNGAFAIQGVNVLCPNTAHSKYFVHN